jgi:cytochrome c oxidase assembly protein subunit 15
MSKSALKNLVNIAIVLAWCVLLLGAYTRLTDAGLGCPDWPGCYGHLVMPSADVVQKAFPNVEIESTKAWTEMLHRYLAGSLLLTVIGILAVLRFNIHFFGLVSGKLQLFLLLLLGFQAALGMWTVTLKLLPIVVMGHLLGGFLIFSSLVAIRAQLMDKIIIDFPCIKRYVFLGMVLVFVQIALGAWVSSNYAGISCLGFPMCNGQWIPPLNWSKAFDFFHQVGPNYQGGLLDIDARMTIQWVHRVGALLVVLYWSVLCFVMAKKVPYLKKFSIVIISFIALQVILGIINVIYLLPIGAAVLHNGVGALVLGSIVFLFNLVVCRPIYDSK